MRFLLIFTILLPQWAWADHLAAWDNRCDTIITAEQEQILASSIVLEDGMFRYLTCDSSSAQRSIRLKSVIGICYANGTKWEASPGSLKKSKEKTVSSSLNSKIILWTTLAYGALFAAIVGGIILLGFGAIFAAIMAVVTAAHMKKRQLKLSLAAKFSLGFSIFLLFIFIMLVAIIYVLDYSLTG
jgi:hypothetical protein